jgi:hypothetical protein
LPSLVGEIWAMKVRYAATAALAAIIFVGAGLPASGEEIAPPEINALVVDALDNAMGLERPGQDGYATLFDGNKYVQCGRAPDKGLRCEAAGSLLQSSLERVLTPERVAQLAALGWRLDASFGNYVQTFPPGATTDAVADAILQALGEVYGADLPELQAMTAWLPSEPCPPRNGPSQDRAGMINNERAMAKHAIHACAYIVPPDEPSRPANSIDELVALYGARMTGEIQRLRVNLDRRVYVIFDPEIGYVQCAPEQKPPAIYCEAQSADSWPALASVLTPDRVARLHAAGFADPGAAPNYSKKYPLAQFDDAAIARELLAVLHDVYGYAGRPKLKVTTE